MKTRSSARNPFKATGTATATAVAAFALALAFACDAPAAEPLPVVAFCGVNVVSMRDERVLRDHAVLVRDGLIEAIGARRRVDVPADARRVDGHGTRILAGEKGDRVATRRRSISG